MKKRKLRIISKIGLLFVVMGFFLPMSCNLNGFQIAKTVETWGGPTILSFSLYSIFIFSCIGLILLAALLMKKKFSIGYDWADLIIIILTFAVFLYYQIKSSDYPLVALFNRLQSGAYIIFIGLVGSLCFLIEATWKSKDAKNKDVHGTTQSEISSDKVFVGERVLDEDTKKEIAIREKLFNKIQRMEISEERLFFILLIPLQFLLFFSLWLPTYKIEGDLPFYFNILFGIYMIICTIIGMFIAQFLLRLIFFIKYDKKILAYWRILHDDLLEILFKTWKNKKEHLELHGLWGDLDDYYRVSPSNFTIPTGFTAIGNVAFSNWTGLASIAIPEGITSIGNWAFSHCTSLASLTIPDSVTSIGNYAFGGCTSLTSITIPASVATIGEFAFSNFTNTLTINVPFANANAKPSGWHADWNGGNAIIKYWNGTTWEKEGE